MVQPGPVSIPDRRRKIRTSIRRPGQFHQPQVNIRRQGFAAQQQIGRLLIKPSRVGGRWLTAPHPPSAAEISKLHDHDALLSSRSAFSRSPKVGRT
jgi:hypothetical protein